MKKTLLGLCALMMILPMGFVLSACFDFIGIGDGDGVIDPDPLTITLSHSVVVINDFSLEQTILVSGTAQGPITLDTSDLPVGVTAEANEDSITVTGVNQGEEINGEFEIVISRDGVSNVLFVMVDLTVID